MYGVAFFLLEAYHDQGTLEENAWAMLGLFSTAGIAGKRQYVLSTYLGIFTCVCVQKDHHTYMHIYLDVGKRSVYVCALSYVHMRH